MRNPAIKLCRPPGRMNASTFGSKLIRLRLSSDLEAHEVALGAVREAFKGLQKAPSQALSGSIPLALPLMVLKELAAKQVC